MLRIIFLYLTGLILRFFLIKYCNVDVFHDYFSLYSNLYYLLMAILSVLTIEISHFIPNWTNAFECVKIFMKHCLQGKKILMGPNSGSYGDINSISRKGVCSMNNDSDNSGGNSDKGNGSTSATSSEPDSRFFFNGTETEIERLEAKIEQLEAKIHCWGWVVRDLNDPETRSLANKLDNHIPLQESEHERWNLIINLNVPLRNRESFFFARDIYGNNEALNGEVNRRLSSVRRTNDKIGQYRQRIQTIITETENSQNSQNQGTNATNSNNNN